MSEIFSLVAKGFAHHLQAQIFGPLKLIARFFRVRQKQSLATPENSPQSPLGNAKEVFCQ